MTVEREEIERIARLSSLGVDAESLGALTAEIGRILEYVSRLEASVPDSDDPRRDSGAAGPDTRTPLRADEVRPTPLAIPLDVLAPRFQDGLFLVPRLGALDLE